MLKTAIVCLFLINSRACFAQFIDVSGQSEISVNGLEGMYGNGVSLYDFNKDGLDDLTFCTKDDGVHTYINDGSEFIESVLIEPIAGDIKQATWVDFDNDGDADFFCTIYGNSCKLFRNESNGVFLNITDSLYLPSTTGMSFGAAWADYDRDGFLDVYVANYDFILPEATTNWLFHNNGLGAFEEVAAIVGADNGYRATFQPTWIDLDNDLYPDLHIINDKYHGNTFYHNTASGFIDESVEHGLGMEMEAMSNSWSDFDNDLDLDVYISNTTQGNKLMRNDGDYFTDIAVEAGVDVNSVCWSALWIDYDHNREDDLHVATNSQVINNNANKLFRREAAVSFYGITIQGDNAGVISTAMGDINSDGYIDFVEMEQYPLGISIFRNSGGSHHWLKISLEGQVSNRDGIGAVISTFINGEQQLRSTFCGEGFLTQNSQYEILSLGNSQSVDSLFIQWPSGWIDKYYDVDADQTIQIKEGETYAVNIINVSGHELCPGDTVLLFVDGGSEINWNDGSQNQFLSIHEAGDYAVVTTNEFGISATSNISVTQYELPAIEWTCIHPACADSSNGAIELSIMPAIVAQVEWLGHEGNDTLENLPAGNYYFKVTDTHGCVQEGEVQLIQPLPLSVEILGDTICTGEYAQVIATISGGTGSCSIDWMDFDPDSIPVGSYQFTANDENNCATMVEFEIVEQESMLVEAKILNPVTGSDGAIGLVVTGGASPYQYHWSTKQNESFIENLVEGVYDCLITDSLGCETVFSTSLISSSMKEHDLNLVVYPIPFHDYLKVKFEKPISFCIYDIHGNLVYTSFQNSVLNNISTSNWAGGVYFLHCNEINMLLLKD